MSYTDLIEFISKILEMLGVLVILGGIIKSTVLFFYQWYSESEVAYIVVRKDIGRAILLGLEFLIAGDIIHSVAIAPSFTSVGILGLIVLIRSFLSIELEKEIDGVWPWERRKKHGV